MSPKNNEIHKFKTFHENENYHLFVQEIDDENFTPFAKINARKKSIQA